LSKSCAEDDRASAATLTDGQQNESETVTHLTLNLRRNHCPDHAQERPITKPTLMFIRHSLFILNLTLPGARSLVAHLVAHFVEFELGARQGARQGFFNTLTCTCHSLFMLNLTEPKAGFPAAEKQQPAERWANTLSGSVRPDKTPHFADPI